MYLVKRSRISRVPAVLLSWSSGRGGQLLPSYERICFDRDEVAVASRPDHVVDTARSERLAVDAVLASERALDHNPIEMPHNHKGYDIETRGADGQLMFIEVKGRVSGSRDFSITPSEIICALNNTERHILALVEVAEDDSTDVRYLYDPFTTREHEPSTAEHKRTLDWPTYRTLAGRPR